MNTIAKSRGKSIQFESTDRVGELEFSGKVLVANWKPYKWEDENWGIHYVRSLDSVNKAAEEYDVFDVYTTDGQYICNYFEDYGDGSFTDVSE